MIKKLFTIFSQKHSWKFIPVIISTLKNDKCPADDENVNALRRRIFRSLLNDDKFA